MEPTCIASNSKATRFCVYQKCANPAWICKSCQNEQCEKTHTHCDNKIISMRWIDIVDVITRTLNGENKSVLIKHDQLLEKMKVAVGELIARIRIVYESYQKYIKQTISSLKINEPIKITLDKIESGNFSNVFGRDMKNLYQVLTKNEYFENQKQLDELCLSRGEKTAQFFLDIQEKINDYQKFVMRNDQTSYDINAENVEKSTREKMKRINRLLESNPNEAIGYYQRAEIYISMNKKKQAQADLIKCLDLNRNFDQAYYKLGQIQFQAYRIEQAEQNFSKTIALNNNHARAHNLRGQIYISSSRFEEGLQDYNTAIRLDPELWQAYCGRGFLMRVFNKCEQSIQDYSQAIELNPRSDYAYLQRGIAYALIGKFDKAIEDFNLCIKINPYNGICYTQRAHVYKRLGMIKEATDDEKKAKKLNG